ncbi:MAG: hypothetical protein R3C62_00760 [Chloroflexota bacterium]
MGFEEKRPFTPHFSHGYGQTWMEETAVYLSSFLSVIRKTAVSPHSFRRPSSVVRRLCVGGDEWWGICGGVAGVLTAVFPSIFNTDKKERGGRNGRFVRVRARPVEVLGGKRPFCP